MDHLPGKLHFSPGNILSFFFLLQLQRPGEATIAQAEAEGMSDEYKCCNTHDL